MEFECNTPVHWLRDARLQVEGQIVCIGHGFVHVGDSQSISDGGNHAAPGASPAAAGRKEKATELREMVLFGAPQPRTTPPRAYPRPWRPAPVYDGPEQDLR